MLTLALRVRFEQLAGEGRMESEMREVSKMDLIGL